MKIMPALPPRMFLALTIFVGVLIMGVRAGDVWDSVTKGPAFKAVKEVQAEEKQPAPKTEDKAPKTEAPTKPPSMQAEALDKDSDLYRQMLGRREQLDKREGEIDTREAMVKIAEKRIDQKIKELETLRQQVQTLLGQASAAQATQIENLVKIYETMKPKEAARIFETLEMPVLLGVVQKMKPARTAAVMAEMDPQKAKDITVALTRQDQLPQIK